MRPSSITLSQLAVLAKILCLLMVVMCGAVPSTVRSVSLYSVCSRGNITVMGRSVRAARRDDENEEFQKLTTLTDDFQMRMYIYAEKSKRYICFTKRWKLVAVPKKKRDKFNCMFTEVYSGRYLRYHSVHNKSRYIGFNKSGAPISVRNKHKECLNFIKVNPFSGVERHNEIVASKGGMKRIVEALRPASRPHQPVHSKKATASGATGKRRQQQPMNSLVPSESSILQDNRQIIPRHHHHRHKHTGLRHEAAEGHERRPSSPPMEPKTVSSSRDLLQLRAEAVAANSKY
ncbi:uncharacterized protein LOC106646811 isoform X2 [Copidosoma floridanum]|uniref:uncharacterized protein LOC106646811 isoform X2 n=1 Tax=Copidosoma floridanum TaxID=29053 RepID=UPI0006C98FA2|nr:uncharacterized protein LOC106646811 isoform X2 [Copidosoma floridanum]